MNQQHLDSLLAAKKELEAITIANLVEMFPNNKLQQVRYWKQIKSLGLKEAKDEVDTWIENNTPLNEIETILKEKGLDTFFGDYGKVTVQNNIIMLNLPWSNKDWTFAAYKCAIKICKVFTHAYPSYCTYINGFQCNRQEFIYIEVSII